MEHQQHDRHLVIIGVSDVHSDVVQNDMPFLDNSHQTECVLICWNVAREKYIHNCHIKPLTLALLALLFRLLDEFYANDLTVAYDCIHFYSGL